MNTLVRNFFQTKEKEEPLFHKVIFLSECPDSWDDIRKISSELPRGWFELCRLSSVDRIEFMCDFWLNLLPYHPSFHIFLTDFFDQLDDVGVVLSQVQSDAPWVAEMIYSLQDNSTFFRGMPPVTETELDGLKHSIGNFLPHDYLSFLRIHNGFGKLSDLGLLKMDQVIHAQQRLLDLFLWSERSLRMRNQTIDPRSLIPFYESYGLGSYQCFFKEWYPGSEMGNVYLSGIDYTISDYRDRKEWADQMAFPTFLDWLAFYLEGNSLE